VGTTETNLSTTELTDFWEARLNTKSIITDENITNELVNFNPDAIISIGESYNQFDILNNKPFDIRKRWIHIDKITESLGDIAYDVSMNSMLINDTFNLISFFTPTYNTGNKLRRTYQSLVDQTYNNWEWIIVDDSIDNGITYSIAKKISQIDERVKVYKFDQRSGGIIGEAKYRAASLCNGEILAELDHDDILLERTAEYLNNAQKEYPDVGFFYTDCIEVDENYNSLMYPDGFAFGYGSYYDYIWRGKNYKVAKECNINPKTIRHIVSIPNHIRAWRRTTYHSIGGHNRRLSIADDYELIVRTFLNTKLCRIPYPGYIQFIYDNSQGTNTHNATRKDIQRRVWSIANYYNLDIKKRFEELGVVDWAYEESPIAPLNAESRYGESEGYINLTYTIQN
jgi:glycosyltransferase involved in cell wall biosynthesis